MSDASARPRTDDLVTVRVIGLPVPIHVRASEHIDALTREFEIIRRADGDLDTVPTRLHALIDELDGQFTAFTTQPRGLLQHAIDSGAPEVDLDYQVPVVASEAARRLQALLDEADAYCRAGDHLLTLAADADVLAYRRWFLDQFSRQAEGHPAVPWQARPDEQREVAAMVRGDEHATAHDTMPRGWSVERDGEAVTVHLSGDLDLQAAPVLRELLTRVDAGTTHVRMDLRAVTFLDSVGISVILAAYQRFTGAGASFAMLVPPRVLRTLTIAGVAELLDARPVEPTS